MTFDQYIRTEAGFDWIMSTTFEQRAVALCKRILSGERINLFDGAAALGLPLATFIELLPALQADLRMHAGTRAATLH